MRRFILALSVSALIAAIAIPGALAAPPADPGARPLVLRDVEAFSTPLRTSSGPASMLLMSERVQPDAPIGSGARVVYGIHESITPLSTGTYRDTGQTGTVGNFAVIVRATNAITLVGTIGVVTFDGGQTLDLTLRRRVNLRGEITLWFDHSGQAHLGPRLRNPI